MEPYQQIPEVTNTFESPSELARQLSHVTGRKVIVRNFDRFAEDLGVLAKSPDALLRYAVLTCFFPRCIQAVLNREEKPPQTGEPLVLLVRKWTGCTHALAALYEFHPLPAPESPWNDALYDHERLWTWKQCELCAAARLRPS